MSEVSPNTYERHEFSIRGRNPDPKGVVLVTAHIPEDGLQLEEQG
jgi:hypothetical protein